MMPGAPRPEIPHPSVPGQPDAPPGRTEPLPLAPLPQVPEHTHVDDPVDRLRTDRRLLLMGALDHPSADRLCAELMLADGISAEPIELIVNSRGGPADAVLAIIDVISLLRAPLVTRCVGTATGTAAVVLVSGTAGRSATANAMIDLRIDDTRTIDGRAGDIARDAAQIADVWDRIAQHVARVSAMLVEQAAAALRDGGQLRPDQAEAAGLIDHVARR